MEIIFVKIKVLPGKRKELSQTIHSIVEHLRREKGCKHAGFYQDVENEDDFLMVEDWATRTDLDQHMASDIFTVLRGAGSLMQRPPEIVIHTVSHARDFEAAGAQKTNGRG